MQAKKFGGSPSDYLEINNMMDSSKSAFPDNRHRAIFHNSMGPFIMEKIFGVTIMNSEGKTVSVREIAEQHIIEDFGFIPSVHDYLSEMEYKPWMEGKGKPPSVAKLNKNRPKAGCPGRDD